MTLKQFPILLLTLALLFAGPAHAAVLTAGIPAEAHIIYGADFMNPGLQTIIKTSFDKIKASPEFAKFLDEFQKEAGFAIAPTFLDKLQTIAGFRVGLVINKADPDKAPGVILVLQFKDAAAATAADGMLKEKIAKDFATDILVGEFAAGGKKLVSLDEGKAPAKDFAKKMFKKVTFNYLLEGDQVAVYIIPKDEADKKAVLPVVEASLACLADPKKSISETAGFKDLLARAGGDSPILLYVSSEIIDIANKQNAKIPPVIDYIGMTTVPSADYMIMKTKVIAKLKANIEKESPLPVPFAQIKSLLQGGVSGMDALPGDTLLGVGVTFNITKDYLALPPVAAALAEMKKQGTDLEELLLKWFAGEISIGIGAYPMPKEADLKAGNFTAPDVYIAIKTKDAAATLKSLDQLLKLSPLPLQPVDAKDLGADVKNIPIPMLPPNIKKFDLHYGICGGYLVIASTKDAMVKAVAVGAKKDKALVETPEFKESCPETGFATVYANVEELTKLAKIVKMMNPAAAGVDDIKPFQKRFGVTVAFPGDSVALVMGSKADYNEALDMVLNEFKKKFSGAPEAPKVDAPKVDEPKGDEPKVEEPKGDEPAGDGKVEMIDEKAEPAADEKAPAEGTEEKGGE